MSTLDTSLAVAPVAVTAPAATASSPTRAALRQFMRSPSGVAGALMLLGLVLATLFGPLIYPVDPLDIAGLPFTPPSADSLLGTDYLGRDILAGLIHGGRATLMVGGVAALITITIGVTIGALSGFFGGWVDSVLVKIAEFFQVLPPLLFAMVLVTLFGQKLTTITLAIGAVSWTSAARLTRAEFMRLRDLDFIKASRAAGASNAHLILRVVLPNALPPIIVSATLAIGVAILFEGGLSFLGLGDPNTMSWGLMIGQNRNYVLDAWWAVTFPGAAIFLAVLAISLVGDGVNDAVNPRLRRR
ncbi:MULTISPECIES: ABC transporter permease [Rhodopseudomonas]|uniref:ABC transporter permease n=1 Tax=Rhodopseudomonas palustris TaxID=1076 RepID=A0A0D7EMA1_RHOPL|nr:MULTISPECIES: ABC transporter permease [Rhodopseudomonas]KIZ41923.1 ABC transporter permease [Rhodopseudomonas palustris]MDF3814088.1 ABC transporter permease [Rhodopseudomonas sp. BAL398]WOK15773.1 ABC transporter permease [Rhodopseudomonas sp. BAL398]